MKTPSFNFEVYSFLNSYCTSKIDSQTYCDSGVLRHPIQKSISSRDLTQVIFQLSAGSTRPSAAEQAPCPLQASGTSPVPLAKGTTLPQARSDPWDLSPAIPAALPRRPLPGEASGEAPGEPLAPAGAASHRAARRPPRARPAACLTFSPSVPLRHPPGRLDPGPGPGPPPLTAPQARRQLARPPARPPTARQPGSPPRGWLGSGPPAAPGARTTAIAAVYASPPPRTTPPGRPHREGTRDHREPLHPSAPLSSAPASRRWLSLRKTLPSRHALRRFDFLAREYPNSTARA